jgi:hypothetical protein
MKRLALLSVVTMMMASAVFAPVAVAQVPGEIDVTSATLGPAGSVTVTGTIQCLEGYYWIADITVRQKSKGNSYNTASGQDGYTNCPPGTEQVNFSVTQFGERPFHGGKAAVSSYGILCSLQGSCDYQFDGGTEAVHLR